MKKSKKLMVNRETIRQLSSPLLRGAAGGVTTPPVSLGPGTACPGSDSVCICVQYVPPALVPTGNNTVDD